MNEWIIVWVFKKSEAENKLCQPLFNYYYYFFYESHISNQPYTYL